MYVCGPTVYKPSHIGHMVGPVIFDTVKRYLTYLGFQVTWVVNITDVDDKLINRARELNTTVKELAERMTADYLDCLKRLNVTGIDGASSSEFDPQTPAPVIATMEEQKAYVEDRKLTGVFTFDRSSAAMKAFAVPHTSYIVVVGTDRRVVYTGVGDDQDIDAVLAKLATP